jgi:hypothetical protein
MVTEGCGYSWAFAAAAAIDEPAFHRNALQKETG